MKKRLPGRIVPEALRKALQKPATTAYPAAPAEIGPRVRGKLIYDPSACIGCGLCMRDCPAGAITVKNLGTKEDKDMHAYLDLGLCVYCGQCAESCPKHCLRSGIDVFLAARSREALRVEL